MAQFLSCISIQEYIISTTQGPFSEIFLGVRPHSVWHRHYPTLTCMLLVSAVLFRVFLFGRHWLVLLCVQRRSYELTVNCSRCRRHGFWRGKHHPGCTHGRYVVREESRRFRPPFGGSGQQGTRREGYEYGLRFGSSGRWIRKWHGRFRYASFYADVDWLWSYGKGSNMPSCKATNYKCSDLFLSEAIFWLFMDRIEMWVICCCKATRYRFFKCVSNLKPCLWVFSWYSVRATRFQNVIHFIYCSG